MKIQWITTAIISSALLSSCVLHNLDRHQKEDAHILSILNHCQENVFMKVVDNINQKKVESTLIPALKYQEIWVDKKHPFSDLSFKFKPKQKVKVNKLPNRRQYNIDICSDNAVINHLGQTELPQVKRID